MSDVVEAGAALDTLVHQFSDPFSFYRELVQNALDAGSHRVDVSLRHAEEELVVVVEDWGEGMTADIIDTQLTRLFSSRKAGDSTQIGKFGIGFVSVFAIQPATVLLETARSGEGWSVLFRGDRSFVRSPLVEAREGTRITLRKSATAGEFAEFARRSRETLSYWCRHVKGEVRLDGQPINQPFDLEFPCRVRSTRPGTEIVAGYAEDFRSWIGFYNRGLTLLESSRAHVFPGVMVKLSSELLEHTLTRDNVVYDEGYFQAMREARELIDGPLIEHVLAELERSRSPHLYRAAARHYGWSQARVFAALDFSHQDGLAEGEEWVAAPGRHHSCHILYGPYVTDLSPGPSQADFRLRVARDSVADADLPVATIDIFDAATGCTLAARSLRRKDFERPGQAQDFRLGFSASSGQKLEFRTWWAGSVALRQSQVRIFSGSRRAPESDPERLSRKLFTLGDGREVSLGEVLTALRAGRLLVESQESALTRALQPRFLVLRAEPDRPEAELLEALGDARPTRASEAYVLPQAVTGPQEQALGPTLQALRELARVWGGRTEEVHLAHLGAADWPAVAVARLGEPVPRKLQGTFFAPLKKLVVNLDHPAVTSLLSIAPQEPELAAYLLAKLFWLQAGLDPVLDSRLAWRAWQLRC